MIKSEDFQKAIDLIGRADSVLITTHRKPDGDACGSVTAFCDALAVLGKDAKALMLSEVAPWYEFLFADKAAVFGDDVTAGQLAEGRFGDFDLIIIVDTASYSQLDEIEAYLKENHKPVLIIDHHVTSDGLGDVILADASAAASGLLVLELFEYAGWTITEQIARALFVAIATDTGWFEFSNTDSRVYNAAARLVDAGAKPTDIYDKLYHNFSHARFGLMLAMLDTLELHFDGRYASQHIRLQDFERTDTTHKDTENMINECHRIGSVEASALFVELEDGRIRCSLRSRSEVDVCKIARKFGGGGHKMASGTYLPGPLEIAKQLVYDEMSQQLD